MEDDVPGLAESVRAGVALLDEIEPGWYRKIDASRLDMNDTGNCILGQLYGNYWDACEEFIPGFPDSDRIAWACDRGFHTTGDYAHLTRAWLDMILEYRDAAATHRAVVRALRRRCRDRLMCGLVPTDTLWVPGQLHNRRGMYIEDGIYICDGTGDDPGCAVGFWTFDEWYAHDCAAMQEMLMTPGA